MQGEADRLRESEVKKDPKNISMSLDEAPASLKQIADYQIEQQGVMAVDAGDSEIFMFTETTLLFMLEKARTHPDRKVVVVIPKKKAQA